MSSPDWPLLYLRVAADPDPGALARIIERFQNLNIVPRRVIADWATTGTLHIQVDITGLPEDRIDLIAAKLSEVPCILNAYWHR
jgi:hypothetical protein